MTALRPCRPPFPLATLLVLTAVAGGCLWRHRVGVTESGTPKYDRVAIEYEVDGENPALAGGRPGGVELAAGTEEDTALSEGQWESATLSVRYPSPDDPQMARATLRLSRCPEDDSVGRWVADRLRSFLADIPGEESGDTERTAGCQDEIWVLDFPREQLDLLLVDLADGGFFDTDERPGQSQLRVRIDRGETAKSWTGEPRLDDLVARVYRNGWISGFAEPRADAGL